MQKRPRVIQLMFGALSIVIGFNLDLPSLVDNLSDAIGFKDPSVGRSVLIGIAVPAAIVGITWLTVSLYQWVLWPLLPGLGCRSGVWMYVLMAHIDDEDVPVAGWFRVQHSPWDIEITEARAYYLDDHTLVFRGDWSSDVVWAAPRRFSIVFTMIADGVVREPMPSQYQGYIQLGLRTRGPHGERSLWTGHFHDLGDRRGVHGPVVCIRTRRWSTARSSAEELLMRQFPQLLDTVLEVIGRKPVLEKPKPTNAPLAEW